MSDETPYALGNEVRRGVYPGNTVSVHASHGEAVMAMLTVPHIEIRGYTWRCACGSWPYVKRRKCHRCGNLRPVDVEARLS